MTTLTLSEHILELNKQVVTARERHYEFNTVPFKYPELKTEYVPSQRDSKKEDRIVGGSTSRPYTANNYLNLIKPYKKLNTNRPPTEDESDIYKLYLLSNEAEDWKQLGDGVNRKSWIFPNMQKKNK